MTPKFYQIFGTFLKRVGKRCPWRIFVLTNTALQEQMLCGVEEPLDVEQLRVTARVEGFDDDFKDRFLVEM